MNCMSKVWFLIIDISTIIPVIFIMSGTSNYTYPIMIQLSTVSIRVTSFYAWTVSRKTIIWRNKMSKKYIICKNISTYLNSGSMNILRQWLNFFLLQVILKPRVTLSFYTSITCTASHNRAISNRERRKNIINSLEIYTYLYNTNKAIHMKWFCILICHLFIL